MKRILCTIASLLIAASMMAGEPQFKLNLNNASGIYSMGSKAVVSCCFEAPVTDSLSITIYRNSKPIDQFKLSPVKEGPHGWSIPSDLRIFEGSYDETCHIMVEVKQTEELSRRIGFVVAPEGFRTGYEEPADMKAWWDKQKKQLERMPMNVKSKALEVPEYFGGKYVCNDVEVDCLGPKPMRAYFAKPIGAKKKSLPIIILCRAAGVSGSWCRCNVNECVGNAALGNGALSLDLNAHGMLNGQDDAYYTELENNELLNYWNKGVNSREDYYFHGMYLRVLRAVQFMTKQPEWDGKHIIVIGESQGGGQTAAVAGLDTRVSTIVLNVPALIDLGGAEAERLSGWPQPIENHADESNLDSVLPYFDAGLMLKWSKADIFCEIGLTDTTCPAPAVWSGLNNAQGKKTINCVPYRDHSWPSGNLREEWERDYMNPRLAFIEECLK